ncbi:division plane positioning ATPase MipZ [Pantoea cypripedii]|uniref:Cobyrinic acid ac-diamide synthase n=1 Tax=Pantoea cypripedii TaxID=55209 RepID=A0A6B9GC19_PANCY|nr:division plane positioning ATPase MipZ [Pantoea cypripedii]QGY32910.1 cobyrinic acid ac-diamide synthase [Pantoea cypripedii]
MIVLLGNEKGGCGKSTLSCNITAELARQGKDVMLIDADKQGTASRWISDRNRNESLPVIHSIQKFDNIRETILDMAQRYEVVVVDTAGRDSRELRTGMTAADVLLVPFRPSQADLDLLPRMEELITAASDMNPTLKVRAMITMAPSNPVINETREAREYLAEYPQMELMRTIVRDRKVYRDALSEGKGVVEMNNSQAKAEIQLLVKELF